jgi:uncharacterized protein (DUF362 family)
VKDPSAIRRMDRRAFLRGSAKAGLALAGACGLGLGLYDPQGPSGRAEQAGVKLPDFSRPQAQGRLAIASGSERAKLLQAALKALGGMGEFIKPGETVLIKPNVAFASPAAIGATSNPQLLAALIQACRDAGAGRVLVSDNPIQDPAACFRFSGLAQVCRDQGAELILPRPAGFAPYSLEGGRLLKAWPLLYEPLNEADRIIGLAPVKDHHRSMASLSMKNWYGLLGGERAVFHQAINGIITELARMIKPSLVVLDGVQAMVRNGPTGGSLDDLKAMNTLIVSTDQVAADTLGVELLGLDPAQVPFLGQAQAAGCGTMDYQSLAPKRLEA